MSDNATLPPELTGQAQWRKWNSGNADTRLAADQRAQLYLELYKQQMAYFHETRRIEFQANLALWGAIFAVGYALAGKVHPSACLSIIFVIGTVLLSGVWAWLLQKTKNFDKKLFAEYRARIERLLEAEPLHPVTTTAVGEHAWCLFYVTATLVFSISVVLFLRVIPLAS